MFAGEGEISPEVKLVEESGRGRLWRRRRCWPEREEISPEEKLGMAGDGDGGGDDGGAAVQRQRQQRRPEAAAAAA